MSPGVRRHSPQGAHVALGAVLTLATVGCELPEVALTEPEDVLVVEAVVQMALDDGSRPPRARVLMHRTGAEGRTNVPGARVTFSFPGGRRDAAEFDRISDCAAASPSPRAGTCYGLEIPELEPGMRVEIAVETARGERVLGETTVPASFEIVHPAGTCVQKPRTLLEVAWTQSDGAWAYLSETDIFGLPEAVAPLGIETRHNPLSLIGLSVSASDTTVVFPSEFGVLERLDLDRDLALYLQEGLPPRSSADVSIAAADRNYVNWVRGADFNPSGTVRIPSVSGDGTGFFGSGVYRSFEVLVNPAPNGGVYPLPPCEAGR